MPVTLVNAFREYGRMWPSGCSEFKPGECFLVGQGTDHTPEASAFWGRSRGHLPTSALSDQSSRFYSKKSRAANHLVHVRVRTREKISRLNRLCQRKLFKSVYINVSLSLSFFPILRESLIGT